MAENRVEFETFYYPLVIQETSLDLYGHVNNAEYLRLFEEARWDLITKRGYGLEKIKEYRKGPIILEIKISYLKEVRAREEVVIASRGISYERKISKMEQQMVRNGEVMARAEITFGLFDLVERKLVMPTPEWLEAIGVKQTQLKDNP